MKHTEMPYEIMLISSKDLIVPKAYQRRLRPSRVSRIVSEFDEHIANEPKVSFRIRCYNDTERKRWEEELAQLEEEERVKKRERARIRARERRTLVKAARAPQISA